MQEILTKGVVGHAQLNISKYAMSNPDEYAAEAFAIIESKKHEELTGPAKNLNDFLQEKSRLLENAKKPPLQK